MSLEKNKNIQMWDIKKIFNWYTSIEHNCINVMIWWIFFGDANEFHEKTNNEKK